MTALYDARGKGSADLALHYSPKAKRDVQLSGQLQFLHFLYCEIDCQVATADYSPRSAIISLAGDKFAALVDAQGHVRDLSGVLADITAHTLTPKGLDRLRALHAVAIVYLLSSEYGPFAMSMALLAWPWVATFIDIGPDGLVLRETAPDVSLETVQAATGPALEVPHDCILRG